MHSRWNSFFQASGLAASNTQLYISLALMVYLIVVVQSLRQRGSYVQWKPEKEKQEELLKERVYEFVLALEKEKDMQNDKGERNSFVAPVEAQQLVKSDDDALV